MSDKDINDYYKNWLNGTLLMGRITTRMGAIVYTQICLIKGVKSLVSNEKKKIIANEIPREYEKELKIQKLDKTNSQMFEEMLFNLEKGTATYANVGRKLALQSYFEECKTLNKQPI